jgi:hypothetical protein
MVQASKGLNLRTLRSKPNSTLTARPPTHLAVSDAAIIQDLQQHIEHIRMRLLHLVHQHHAVGAAAHGIREQAALLVAHVTRGAADEAAHAVLLHVLGHVQAHLGRGGRGAAGEGGRQAGRRGCCWWGEASR